MQPPPAPTASDPPGASRPESAPPQATVPVTVAALGDLILTGEWTEALRRADPALLFPELGARLAAADLVFANLETTLPAPDGEVGREPSLIGEAAAVENALTALRLDLVSLANNHAFDAGEAGFAATRELLARRGVRSLGAGRDAAEAARPLAVALRGVRFGWLAYAALDTAPARLAGRGAAGVNPLDAARAVEEVARLAEAVDHVIVSLHWGIEYCHAPSPEQLRLGRALADAGARLVLGHHAHVVQGVERRGGAAIAYNLGNATTADVSIGGRPAIRQSRRTRSSLLLLASFDRRALTGLELVPLYARAPEIRVGDRYARRCLERAARQLDAAASPLAWRARRLWEDVLRRALAKLHPRVVGSLRPRHLARAAANLWGALHGRGPA